jgi:DNA damage-binding protein 1
MVGLALLMGTLKIIPIDSKGIFMDAFNIRLADTTLLDLCFLQAPGPPQLVYLCEEGDQTFLRSFTLNIKEKSLSPGLLTAGLLEGGAVRCMALGSGVLCVGETGVQWRGPQQTVCTAVYPDIGDETTRHRRRQIQAVGRIDDSRWLVGDGEDGTLWLVVVQLVNGVVQRMTIEVLGQTTNAVTLDYLDAGCVYVGSAFGDSQVIRLLESRDEETGSLVEVLEQQANHGPITDMAAVDLDGQGQSSLVLCAGAYRTASLRVVRNGIGVTEEAELPLPNITGVWSMREAASAVFDKFLCVSFSGQTIFLAMEDDDDLAELAEAGGLQTDTRTLYCGTVGDQLLQITGGGIFLVDASAGHARRDAWKPNENAQITVCGVNSVSGQLVVAMSRTLVALKVTGMHLQETGRTELPVEASCLDCSPLVEGEDAPVCVVGTWGPEAGVRLLQLPSLQPLAQQELHAEGVVPRSVRFAV